MWALQINIFKVIEYIIFVTLTLAQFLVHRGVFINGFLINQYIKDVHAFLFCVYDDSINVFF